MTPLLHRLGDHAAAHPWRTIAAWALLLVTALGLAAGFGGDPHDDWDVPGTRAQAGTDLLRDAYPEATGAVDRVVVHAADRALTPSDLDPLATRLTAMPHVRSVDPPRLSDDGRTALLQVRYDVPVTDDDLMGDLGPLTDAVAPTRGTGLQVALGGEVPDSATLEAGGTGEVVGVVVALLLLLATFGSVLAAGLPILAAGLGLAVGSAGVALLAATTTVSTSAPTVATMVGLGVGIDYAMLLVTRQAEFLRAGWGVREAVARTTATAGRSVLMAGATVLVSLLGLGLSGLHTFESFGVATAAVVLAVMVTSVVLVPAVLALIGRRVLRRRERRSTADPVATAPVRRPLIARWADLVGRRPLPFAVAGVLLLLTLAAPVTDLRMWPSDTSAQPVTATTRQAYDLVEQAFGPGANGPLVVAVDLTRVGAADLPALTADLATTDGIARVSPPAVSPNGRAAVLVAEPTTGPGEEATTALVDRLREDVLPAGAELTGFTAGFVDINALLQERIWLVIGFVVAISMVLLAMMFRSLVVPVKAALLNLLSIGASYGALVAIFQWGWGNELFGLDQTVPISSWVPILMFAVAFGLSMDYEVFLLSRVREEWLATGDAHGSVVHGLAATGRLISAAAAIMVAVFLGFATEGDLVLKMMGAGMAVAVLVDATVVRLVLVPATMALLGARNWWMPAWLDRLLPRVDAEARPAPSLAPPADDPAGDVPDAVPTLTPAR
ncbi:MMPL family transporter [Phycicoccus flavus]|uniref:MMPL family transporter n=1 Tax=Phycicoccus flavus TaxID=2502783 RepID=UPI000FEBC56D|nr:MMPL family transporter [Phycicoccus flavus]NHA69607.1 MMPL family transporter [Phycicoccus flavus]